MKCFLPEFWIGSLLPFMKDIAPSCSIYLEQVERKPPGKITRSMCVEDYENWIANNINHKCFVCGSPLPSYKIQAQQKNRKEIENHIHDDACMDSWTIIHNVSVGEPDVTGAFRRHSDYDRGYLSQNHVVEVGYVYIRYQPKHQQAGSLVPQGLVQEALPIPAKQLSHRSQQTYKGKPIKVISQRRR